jgi:hypothetical protein
VAVQSNAVGVTDPARYRHFDVLPSSSVRTAAGQPRTPSRTARKTTAACAASAKVPIAWVTV